MRSYIFDIPGAPFAKQRARTLRTGHSYTPKETVIYENLVKTCFTSKYPGVIPTSMPCAVMICAVYPIPKSWSKKDKIKASEGTLTPRKNDWDNVGKIICDALNDVVWLDDNQIFCGFVLKKYGDRPCVRVLIYDYNEAGELKKKGDTDIWQVLTSQY
jgi:Holliday junction resolvase RusA-like endonuclease